MHNIKSYSQWLPGKDNIVADALSRDDNRSDTELTFILHKFAPHQMPPHFKIAPLPSETASWLTLLLLKLPVKGQYREVHMRTKLGRGEDGGRTASPSGLTIFTLSLIDCSESTSSELLPWLKGKERFLGDYDTMWY